MELETFCKGLVNQLATNKIKVMAADTQDDEMFGGEWKKEMNQYNKAAILESFAQIGKKAEHSKQLLEKAKRILSTPKVTMLAYVQNNSLSIEDYGSFEEAISQLEELQKEINIHLKII
jgi:translation initiation factor 2 alpha subunit (eIF-2alpha)